MATPWLQVCHCSSRNLPLPCRAHLPCPWSCSMGRRGVPQPAVWALCGVGTWCRQSSGWRQAEYLQLPTVPGLVVCSRCRVLGSSVTEVPIPRLLQSAGACKAVQGFCHLLNQSQIGVLAGEALAHPVCPGALAGAGEVLWLALPVLLPQPAQPLGCPRDTGTMQSFLS